ncbi:putative Protein phosphatase 2c [Quillaja saponaria]|uniref:Protein phosphatase n=1 Tax=Quillaja saponaria TaxID=32244 RepID=A0AAD7PAT8_QUISA|nr:putative Protein phosphatase 2c [Quillaja saponaria]
MVAGSFYLPKDNPKKPQGEDAHFICLEKQTLGVADGVGGWAKKGIDGGEYARQLMKNSLIAVQNQPRGTVDLKKPEEIEEVLDQRSSTKASMEPEELAWNIAELALHNSLNRHSVSPFSNAARMAGKEHIGGKVDDITVVVAHIV